MIKFVKANFKNELAQLTVFSLIVFCCFMGMLLTVAFFLYVTVSFMLWLGLPPLGIFLVYLILGVSICIAGSALDESDDYDW